MRPILPIALLPLLGICTSCTQLATSLNTPLSDDFNPLDGPSVRRTATAQSNSPQNLYKPGEWLQTTTPNTTFFRRFPRGNASADQILAQGTPLKVISFKNSFIKVELETGHVGYVPSVMVGNSVSNDNAPFLPQINNPSQSLAPTVPDPSLAIPSAAQGELNTAGESLIPPPSNFNPANSSPVELPNTNPLNPAEHIIPTSPAPESLLDALPQQGGTIPPPSAESIDQSIGIE